LQVRRSELEQINQHPNDNFLEAACGSVVAGMWQQNPPPQVHHLDSAFAGPDHLAVFQTTGQYSELLRREQWSVGELLNQAAQAGIQLHARIMIIREVVNLRSKP